MLKFTIEATFDSITIKWNDDGPTANKLATNAIEAMASQLNFFYSGSTSDKDGESITYRRPRN